MTRPPGHTLGIVFAVLAALCNATIGLFTNLGIRASLPADTIAFYRCVVAFLAVTVLMMIRREKLVGVAFMRLNLRKILLCAFCGIFVLYYFETMSYRFTSVTNVTFLLMSTSSIVTFVLAVVLLREKTGLWKLLGLGLVLLGIFFMVFGGGLYRPNLRGDALAVVAGIGYALFMVCARRFKLGSGLGVLWCLFAVGMVYLAVPLIIDGSFALELQDLPIIVLLGVVPTLGGFYCTTRALELLEASQVQMFEMSEPLFASVMAFALLSQSVSGAEACGGAFILFGLLLADKRSNPAPAQL
jgi:drug/metabolite transporter (DMT)-like permease